MNIMRTCSKTSLSLSNSFYDYNMPQTKNILGVGSFEGGRLIAIDPKRTANTKSNIWDMGEFMKLYDYNAVWVQVFWGEHFHFCSIYYMYHCVNLHNLSLKN